MTEQFQHKRLKYVIERFNKAESLIHEDIAPLRERVPVVDSLVVKGYSFAREDINLQKIVGAEDELRQFYELTKPHIRYKYEITNEKSMILLDKMYPHGLLEIMLMQNGNVVKPSICDLDDSLQFFSFKVMKEFSSYANEKGLYPYIAWSYDPETRDRESGQGVKRFHAHLVGRTNEEIEFIKINQQQLKNLEPIRARRLVDETSIIGSYILFDIFKNKDLNTVECIQPFSEKFPNVPNLMFRLKNNWETMGEEKFRLDFNEIHKTFLESYNDIMSCIWDGEVGNWKRPNIREEAVIVDLLNKLPYLTNKTKEFIMYAIKRTQPSLLSKTNFLSQKTFRDITTHIYPLSGPCYSTSVCEIEGDVYCAIRPYMFSDLGGAGICNACGIITKIKKGSVFMDETETSDRFQFQRQFVECVKKSL
jgi:hypothetical protein